MLCLSPSQNAKNNALDYNGLQTAWRPFWGAPENFSKKGWKKGAGGGKVWEKTNSRRAHN